MYRIKINIGNIKSIIKYLRLKTIIKNLYFQEIINFNQRFIKIYLNFILLLISLIKKEKSFYQRKEQ